MGTNYYHVSKPCSECGIRKERRHIGKSSYGWQFHFHGYREDHILSYKDWLIAFDDPKTEIIDEYGETIPLTVFTDLVYAKKAHLNCYNINRKKPKTPAEELHIKESRGYYPICSSIPEWLDDEGNPFTDWEFC